MDFIADYQAKLMAHGGLMLSDIARHDGEMAVVVNNASVRVSPTDAWRGSEAFDDNQLSLILVGERVRIQERVHGWFRVRAYNVAGWVKSENLALGDWPEVFDIPGATVVDNSLILGGVRLTMGVRLPYDGQGRVRLPRREADGRLGEESFPMPRGMIDGFLQPKGYVIVSQARKLPGDPYGWGGLGGNRDCSALVCDIYRTIGIRMPRDTAHQVKVPGHKLSMEMYLSASPGTLMWMPGHVMVAAGGRGADFRVIHALARCILPDGSLWMANRVVETDLLLRRAKTGELFLDALTCVKQVLPSEAQS